MLMVAHATNFHGEAVRLTPSSPQATARHKKSFILERHTSMLAHMSDTVDLSAGALQGPQATTQHGFRGTHLHIFQRDRRFITQT